MITQNTQLEKIKQYCELHNIKLQKEYSDLDYSGRSTSRPDFQKLFHDIQNGYLDNIDYLLVYKLDRFARSVDDFHNYMAILDEHNISFVSVTQNFDTSSPMGRLIRNILVDFAQFESEMTGERVKDNMIENAQEGRWNGGRPPLGYDLKAKDKTGIIKNEKAKQVLKLYQWYLKPDGSIRNNVIKANKQKIPSSTGSEWNNSQMSLLLKNPLYCIANKKSINFFEKQGITVYNQESIDGKRGLIRYNRRAGNTARDKENWIVAVGQHEGIVPAELYIEVQNKRSNRANKPARAGTGKSLLAWLTKCSKCGKAMTYTYTVVNDKKYEYYKCSTKEKKGKQACEGQTVRAEELEEVVLAKLSSICNDRDFLAKLKNKVDTDSKAEELEEKQNKIKNRLTEIAEEESNLIDKLKKSKSDKLLEFVEEELERLAEEKESLQDKLVNLKNRHREIKSKLINKELVLKQLRKFDDIFEKMDFEEKRNFLQSVINKIVYDEGKVRIELFFS